MAYRVISVRYSASLCFGQCEGLDGSALIPVYGSTKPLCVEHPWPPVIKMSP